MAFNPKQAFLANVKHGLIENDKTLEEMAEDMGKELSSIKTRLYKINRNKASVTPLDKEIVAYLNTNCDGFEEWAEAQPIK